MILPFLFLACLHYSDCKAQVDFSASIINTNLDDFNEELLQDDIQGINNIFFNFRIMAQQYLEPKNVELRFSYLNTRAFPVDELPPSTTYHNMQVKGWGVSLGAAYHFLKKGNVRIYPAIDVMPLFSKVLLTKNIPFNNSLTGIINNNTSLSRFNATKLLAEGHLNFDFLIKSKSNESSGYKLGLYVGYRQDFLLEDWLLEENINVNFPEFDFSGLSVGFSVGFFFKTPNTPKIRKSSNKHS